MVSLRSVILFAIAACSAPATLPDLVRAEAREAAGDTDGAIAAYRAARLTCKAIDSRRRARAACAEALLGVPEQLEDAGRTDAAIAEYDAVPARAGSDTATAATALYRAVELRMREQKIGDALAEAWTLVHRYPDEPVAGDGLALILASQRASDPKGLADQLQRMFAAFAKTQVADNMLWSLAQLEAAELADVRAGRAFYDRIPVEYPKSGLRDDARWNAVQLSEQLGDWAGARDRLVGILKTRGSFLFGSDSIWLDDAQLELGRVLRDHFGDLAGAAAAFRKLPKAYPTSILRDDALYELELTLFTTGDVPGACRALADLVKLDPDSKYIADAKARGSACSR